jgi:hypothetical protein
MGRTPGAGKESAVAEPQTARWFAADRKAYVWALLDLADLARTSTLDFSAGPMGLAAMEHQGLTVTGADLTAVREVLGKIAGLAEHDESG